MSGFDCVGVDVAKDKFDVSIEIDGRYKHKVFANKNQGYIDFLTWLNEHTINPWVCMEATGHYSIQIADFLVEHAIRVSVVNPFQVKNFAKATLARNKNDILDSRIIMQFCKRMEPRTYQF
jgi:transposase